MTKQNTINLGLTMSAISIVLFLTSVIIGAGSFASMGIGILSFVLSIVLPIIFINKQKKAEGYILFQDAFVVAFGGLAIGAFVGTVFTYLYIHFIDTAYVDKLVIGSLEMTNKWISGLGDEEATKILSEQEKSMREGFTLLGQLKSFGITLIVIAVVSLILAAILKKKPTVARDSTVLDS